MRFSNALVVLGVGLVTLTLPGLALETASAGTVTPFATDTQLLGVTGLTTDGTNLFFSTNFNGEVGAVSLGNGAVSTLYGGLTSPLGLTVVGSNLVWIDPNAGPGTGTAILQAPKVGGGAITTLYDAGSPIVDGSGITNDGSHLFAADEVFGNIYQLNLNGSGVTQIGPDRFGGFFNNEHFQSITQSAGILYLADSGKTGVISPEVVSIPTSGGSFTTLFSGSPFVHPFGIAIGNNTIFVSDGGANAIWSLPITGGTPTLFASDPRFGSLANLVYLNGSLYVADRGDSTTGTIWKVDPTAAAVPEPGSLTLAAIGGGCCLLFQSWRRRRST